MRPGRGAATASRQDRSHHPGAGASFGYDPCTHHRRCGRPGAECPLDQAPHSHRGRAPLRRHLQRAVGNLASADASRCGRASFARRFPRTSTPGRPLEPRALLHPCAPRARTRYRLLPAPQAEAVDVADGERDVDRHARVLPPAAPVRGDLRGQLSGDAPGGQLAVDPERELPF